MGNPEDSDSIISQLITPHSSDDIDHRHLQHLFRSFGTPSHPPYALMIRRAINELSDGNGLTEEQISEFIRREYKELPWAHDTILGFHLTKLCKGGGELVCSNGGRYMFRVGGTGKEIQSEAAGINGTNNDTNGTVLESTPQEEEGVRIIIKNTKAS